MKWTTSLMFRGLVGAALCVSLSWLALLLLLGDSAAGSARSPLIAVLVWTAFVAAMFWFVLSVNPVVPRPPTKEWVGAASIVIQATPEEVWHFIREPANTTLTSHETERAFHVPGTPDGPGQQQAFIQTGPFGFKQLSLLEITEETPWVRIDVKGLSGPGWSRYELEPVPTGTKLTVTLANNYARWAIYGRVKPRKHLEDHALKYVRSVKQVLESEAEPGGDPQSPVTDQSHDSSHHPTQHHPTSPSPPDALPPSGPGNPPIPT